MNYKIIILLCIILIILLYLFINNKLYILIENYILVVVSIIILSLTFIKIQKKSIDNFTDEIATSVQDSSTSESTTTEPSTIEPTSVDNNSEESENLEGIQDRLTIYLSSYNPDSYRENESINISWNNISPYKNIKNESFTFQTKPIYTTLNQLKLQTNNIKGPECEDLGISMTDDFSIFINIKINSFNDTQNLLKIFEIYGTVDNIGVYLYLKKDNSNSYLELQTAFTDKIIYKINDTNENLFDTNLHLITIVKNSEFIKVYIDLTEIIEVEVKYFDTFNNKFSNRNLSLLSNSDNNITAYITHFGIYAKELSLSTIESNPTIDKIYNFITDLTLKQTTTYNNLLSEFKGLQQSISLSKNNPFSGENIQNNCYMITDWSNYNQLLLNADDKCLKSINDYCQIDKKFEQCKIWNSFQKLVPYFTKEKQDLLDITLDNQENTQNNPIITDESNKNLKKHQSILTPIKKHQSILTPIKKIDFITKANINKNNLTNKSIKPIKNI